MCFDCPKIRSLETTIKIIQHCRPVAPDRVGRVAVYQHLKHLDYTHPLTSWCLTRHYRMYLVNISQGDRERRKSSRNFSTLESLLWLAWSANQSAEPIGLNFRLLFLRSRSLSHSSARRDVWGTVLLLSPLSRKWRRYEEYEQINDKSNTFSKAVSVQSSIVDYLKITKLMSKPYERWHCGVIKWKSN